jgi:hypothetical protein
MEKDRENLGIGMENSQRDGFFESLPEYPTVLAFTNLETLKGISVLKTVIQDKIIKKYLLYCY